MRVQIERTPLADATAASGYICIEFAVPFPCDIRLDRLLAGELGISRSTLLACPDQRGALRKRVRDGMRIGLYKPSKNDLTADKQNGGTSVL